MKSLKRVLRAFNSLSSCYTAATSTVWRFGQEQTSVVLKNYQTNGGSFNWRTMTKPRQMSNRPRLKSSIKQQQLRVLGHMGCGALIVSMTMPLRLFFCDRWFTSSEYGALRYVRYDPWLSSCLFKWVHPRKRISRFYLSSEAGVWCRYSGRGM